MPIPILPVNIKNEMVNENNKPLEISFLSNSLSKESSFGSTMVSDKDADDVMKIWLNAKKIDQDTFEIKSINIDNNVLLRLKSRGLISGSTETIKLTSKGKSVIKTMSLGESNNFLKKRKEKSYTEILASMDKRGKKGYRIAESNVFSEHSHLITLVSQNDQNVYPIAKLMDDLKEHFGKGEVFHGNTNHYYEVSDESLEVFWIQVYYDKWKNNICVDKYYENEFMQNQQGRQSCIQYEENNIETIKQEVIKIINHLMKP
jgi:hypothetical protein